MKKIISLLLAMIMVFSLATVAAAEDGAQTPAAKLDVDATFTKTYNVENADTVSPLETFNFKFTPVSVTNSNTTPALTLEDMPAIGNSTIEFKSGEAGTAAKDVSVALSEINWPGVGIYLYTVEEVAPSEKTPAQKDTAGVTYDTTTQYLKVTVAYDQGTDTYYTAFVSLNEPSAEGVTSNKSNGFVNKYSAGSLEVGKTVTGNLGDTQKEFNVTVTFTAPANQIVNEVITYTDGLEKKTIAAGWDTTATATITLKHDETVTFANIPYGVTYTVVEEDYTAADKGGYDRAEYDFSDDNKKIDGTKDTVEITNNKATVVDTGIALDSAPYFLMLAVALFGMVALVSKKRYEV